MLLSILTNGFAAGRFGCLWKLLSHHSPKKSLSWLILPIFVWHSHQQYNKTMFSIYIIQFLCTWIPSLQTSPSFPPHCHIPLQCHSVYSMIFFFMASSLSIMKDNFFFNTSQNFRVDSGTLACLFIFKIFQMQWK